MEFITKNKSILFLLFIFFVIICISIGYCRVGGTIIKIESVADIKSNRNLIIESVEMDNNISTGGMVVDYTSVGTLLKLSLNLPVENVTNDTNTTILVHVRNLTDYSYKFAGTRTLTQDDIKDIPAFSVVNSNPNIEIDETSYQEFLNKILHGLTGDDGEEMIIPIKFKYVDINNIEDNNIDISIKLEFTQGEKPKYKLKTGRNLYSALSNYTQTAKKILFCSKSEVPTESTSVGEAGETNGEIQIYYLNETLYIATEEKNSIIQFNEDSGYMFSNGSVSSAFSGLTNIEVSNGVTIDTSSVTQFEEMFKGCSSLTSKGLQGFLDLFDTSSAVNMCAMFGGTSGLTEIDLSGFDTSKVTDMSWMFEDDPKLNYINLGGKFSTESVQGSQANEGLAAMFNNCTSLKYLDLRNFNTSKVKSMWQLFKNCSNLEKIYTTDKFVITGLSTSYQTSGTDLFSGCTNLVGENGTKFSTSNVSNSTYAHIDGGTSNPGYFSNFKGYTITLNANNGKFTDGNSTKIYKEKNKLDLTLDDVPKREEYYFAGWAERQGSTAVKYESEDTIIVTSDIELYAIWYDKLAVTLKTGPQIYSLISDYRAEAECISFSYFEKLPNNSIEIGNLDANNQGKIVAYYNDISKTVYFALTDKDYDRVIFNENSSHMFSNGKNSEDAFSKVQTIDVDDGIEIDTGQVKNFAEIFKHNDSLTQNSLQKFIDRFDTSNVTNMCAMFEYLNIRSIDISKLNTDNVTDMSWMFHGSAYTEIIFGNNFNTSKVTNFDGMFQQVTNITELDISILKVSSGATINYMFGLNPNLKRIYVSENSGFENAAEGGLRVFEKDTSLIGGVGENTTNFTSTEITSTYARISTKDTPGYLTNIIDKGSE